MGKVIDLNTKRSQRSAEILASNKTPETPPARIARRIGEVMLDLNPWAEVNDWTDKGRRWVAYSPLIVSAGLGLGVWGATNAIDAITSESEKPAGLSYEDCAQSTLDVAATTAVNLPDLETRVAECEEAANN